MKFIILTTQRSGSHMLASALNKHSKIACAGENYMPNDWIKPDITKPIQGEIIMYNHVTDQIDKVDKVIHLLRDTEHVTKSRLALNQKQETPAHVFKENSKSYNISRSDYDTKFAYINSQKEIWKDVKALNVHYENINYKEILKYLGVNYEYITPECVKTNNIYNII